MRTVLYKDEKATISDFVAFGLCDYLLQFLSDADPAFVCESINFVSQLYSFSTPDDVCEHSEVNR